MGIPWPLQAFCSLLCPGLAGRHRGRCAVGGRPHLGDSPKAISPNESDRSESHSPKAAVRRRAVAPSSHDSEAGAPRIAAPGTTTHPDEATVREILEIRREQGGVLDGTLLDELSRPPTVDRADAPNNPGRWQDEEFARALREVTASASTACRQTSPQARSAAVRDPPRRRSQAQADRTGRPAALSRYLSSRRLLELLGGDEPVDDVELVRALRYASRQLDRKANDLEDVQRYNDADQLRVLSERLRQESRRWVPTLTPPQDPLETPAAPVPAE